MAPWDIDLAVVTGSAVDECVRLLVPNLKPPVLFVSGFPRNSTFVGTLSKSFMMKEVTKLSIPLIVSGPLIAVSCFVAAN